MGLNSTALARYIGSKLGVTHAHLEVSMRFLIDVIKEQSIISFSMYYPLQKKIEIDLSDPIFQADGYNNFIIPTSIIKPENILSLKSVIPSTMYAGAYSYNGMEGGDVLGNYLNRNILSAYDTPRTSQFTRPNIITVYPKTVYRSGKLLVTVNMKHDKNFYTIPNSLTEEFKKLALIDAKDAIYNIRKNYKNITTAFGPLELNMEDFEGMGDKRTDLLDYWKKNYWKSAKRKRIYTTRG